MRSSHVPTDEIKVGVIVNPKYVLFGFILSLVISCIALSGVLFYDMYVAPTHDVEIVISEMKLYDFPVGVYTEDYYKLECYNTQLNTYMYQHRGVPIIVTMRRGVLNDIIIGVKGCNPLETYGRMPL